VIWLIAGIVVFLGIHSVRMVAPGYRDRMIARYGENAWKGIYSLVSLAGFVLLVWGYAQARPDAAFLYEPPVWIRHIVMLFMLVAMILLVAAYLPAGHIKKRVKHPMITAVKVWAFAHLLANGDAASLILFLSFLAWAVWNRIAVKRRGDPVFGTVSARYDIIAVAVGTVLTVWFIMQLHAYLFGVSPL